MLEFQLKEQTEKGSSIPAQLKAIREYADSYGFMILEEYVNEGGSAKTGDRPEFRRMIKRCQKDKPIDAVIVHKIDRFSRTRAHASPTSKDKKAYLKPIWLIQ